MAITPVGVDLGQRTVRVHLQILWPVKAIPEQLFFGTVEPGGTATARIGLHFAPDVAPDNVDSVTLEHDLAQELSLAWSRTEGRFCQLTADLTPRHGDRFIEGEVTLQFAQGGLPTIHLPVRAMVR